MENQNLATIIVAVVTSVFGLAGTIATTLANRKAKSAEQEVERLKVHGLATVDMTRIIVDVQRAVQDNFQAQFNAFQVQQASLEKNLDLANQDIARVKKESDQKLRMANVALQRAENTAQLLIRQINQLQAVFDTIRFNLIVLGKRIEDVRILLPAGHNELHLKVDELARIHATVVTSLESVDLSHEGQDFEALIAIEKVTGPTV